MGYDSARFARTDTRAWNTGFRFNGLPGQSRITAVAGHGPGARARTMRPGIIQLHPDRREYESVKGLYLMEKLREHPRKPLVYANFASSLDGRIAVARDGASRLPETLGNSNDLRLFLELLAQADCVITHGAYLRSRAAGLLGNVFRPDTELDAWRRERGLAPPTVIVCSANLDFPEPGDLGKDRVIIATGENHDPARAKRWTDKGYRVLIAGRGAMVEAGALLDRLSDRESGIDPRAIYLVAGPKFLESTLEARRLDLLYLTLSHQLIGGNTFETLIPNAEPGYCRLSQEHLVLDNSPTLKYPQWFVKFACRYA